MSTKSDATLPVGSSDGASIESDLKVAARYEESGRFTEAEQIYDRLCHLYPDNAELHRRHGLAAWTLQQADRAFELLRRAAALDPASTRALKDLAEQHLALGQLAEAEQAIAQAMERDPKDADLLVKRAVLCLRLGQKALAIQLCQSALAINPAQVGALQFLGTYAWETGDLAKATEYLMVARGQSAHVHDPNGLLASCLFALGRSREIDGLTACATESQLYLEVILQALWTWQVEKLEYCRHLLFRANGLLPKLPETAPRRNQFVLFQRALTALLNYGAANGQAYEAQAESVLVAIGDHHCLAPCHLAIPFQGAIHRVRSATVLGMKAEHLIQPTDNPQRSAFLAALDMLPSDTKILLSLGELDCRHNGGLLTHLKGNPGVDLDGFLSEFVGSYLGTALELAQARGLELNILAGPTPNVRVKNLPLADRELFLEVSDGFNRHLKTAAAEKGLPLIDLYAATRDADGQPVKELFMDGHHCFPTAYLKAFEAQGANQGQ